MAKAGASIQDIVQTLPRSLQRRFESLGGFVVGVIEEQREQDSRDDRLNDEDVALIKFLALVYTLDRFFRSGTENALGAAKAFEELGAQGFRLERPPSPQRARPRFAASDSRTGCRQSFSRHRSPKHFARRKPFVNWSGFCGEVS